MFQVRWGLAACGLLASILAGCGSSGPKLYSATGTVTFEGKPVEGAMVAFIPQQGAPCLGTTDASGKYTIMTRGKPGAPPGTYSVTVAKQSGGSSAGAATGAAPTPTSTGDAGPSEEEMRKMMEGMSNMGKQMQEASKNAAQAKSLLPEKYALPEGSGLSAIVTSDPSKNVFDFALVP